MSKVPDSIKEDIYRAVKTDMEPSRWVVHSKVGTAVAMGGGASLFLCGQMGLGLSPLAVSVHHWLMHYVGYLGCTFLCGSIFAIIPVLLLKALSSKIQFLILLRKERLAIGGWVLSFGMFLEFRNQPQDFLLTIALWGIPALVTFYSFGWLTSYLSKIAPTFLKIP
jgi:hypothetical protein